MIRDILRLDYAAHEALVETAHKKPELWRLGFGVILVIATWIFFMAQFEALFFFLDAFDTRGERGATPATMLIVLLNIGLLLPATAFVVFALHGRASGDVIGRMRSTVSMFVAVFVVQVALIVVIFVLPPYSIEGHEMSSNLGFGSWVLLLPLALPLILLQCTAEEYAFRGYLQQQLAARFKSPLIWLLLPSAFFAFGHYDGQELGENAWLVAALSGLFGLLMADLTARSGSLGPAIAVHTVNNMVAMLFISTSDGYNGLALFVMPLDLSDPAQLRVWLPIDFASMIVSWLAARLVIQR